MFCSLLYLSKINTLGQKNHVPLVDMQKIYANTQMAVAKMKQDEHTK